MQSLIQCQRVQVMKKIFPSSQINSDENLQILLLHEASKGSFSRVFDFEANDDLNERTSPFESRFPTNIGITGHVAATGEVGGNKIMKQLFNENILVNTFILK